MKIIKILYFLRISDNLEVLIQLLRSKYVSIQSLRSIGENWKISEELKKMIFFAGGNNCNYKFCLEAKIAETVRTTS